MVDINSTSPTVSFKELTLNEGDSVITITPLVNDQYELDIDSDLFENRYVFKDGDGFLTIHFVSLKTGETVWVFKDTNVDEENGNTRTLSHPKKFLQKEVINNFSIFVNTKKEISFLEDVALDIKNDSSSATDDKGYLLMNILNTYGIGNSWTCVPTQETTTAYFILRYFGTGEKAPSVYNFNPSAECIAVVDLLTNNEYTTYALIVR